MIKTLIVDDEYLIRQQLILSIDWQGLGFTIIGEASDGKSALEMIRQLQPELVILDINIPMLNGIDLAKIIHKEYPLMKVILLTGYESFDYARQAISAGVVTYLLKPIDSEEISDVLNTIKDKLEKSRRLHQYMIDLESAVGNIQENSKNDYLHNLLTSQVGIDSLERKFRHFGIQLITPPVLVAIFEIDNLDNLWPDNKDRQLWIFSVTNITEEILSAHGAGLSFPIYYKYTVAILQSQAQYWEICQQIKRITEELLDLTLTIGISDLKSDFAKLPEAFLEAQSALMRKFYRGTGQVIQHSDDFAPTLFKNTLTTFELEYIYQKLKEDNLTAVNKKIDEIYKRSIEMNLDPEYFVIEFIDILQSLNRFLVEKNENVADIDLPGTSDFIGYVKTRKTAQEIKEWTVQVFEKAIYRSNPPCKNASILSIRTRKFIESNYHDENLSPFLVASINSVQPSYLSKVFKKDFNQSIASYIIEFRMKMAKKLIDESDVDQISELARLCGYIDPFYFSRSFKKHFGIAPSEYIKLKKGSQ